MKKKTERVFTNPEQLHRAFVSTELQNQQIKSVTFTISIKPAPKTSPQKVKKQK